MLVGALFDQPAVLEEEDPIRPPNCGKPVRDVYRRPAPGQRAKPLEQVILRLGVERRRRLVEQKDAGIAHERAGQRHLLPLAA